MRRTAFNAVSLLLVFHLTGLAGPLCAGAAMVETAEVLQRDDQLRGTGRAGEMLAMEEVRKTMISFGVDPDTVEERLGSLTAEEVRQLEAGLATLPAGGDSALAVIGMVFLVLLILEIVGVTDIFKKV